MTATPSPAPPDALASQPGGQRPHAAIEVQRLHKRYTTRVVIDEVSFSVSRGEVYALAGPNGAGKTTMIRVMTGLAFPSRGKVLIGGEDVHEAGARVRSAIGAVVEAPAAFYPHLSARENLRAQASLAGGFRFGALGEAPRRIDEARISEVLLLTELLHMAGRPVREYSLGQRQRLGLASAVLTNPQILILDEPTSGLDPLGINLVHRILSTLAASGCAVILSTHHLREITSYAHKVGILGAGRMLEEVNLAVKHNTYRFRVDEPTKAKITLETCAFVVRSQARPPNVIAQLESEKTVPDAIAALVREGIRVFEVAPDHFDLYEHYRERVEKL
jgi:ABC-2 type transport system ATP-binding protein